eukprot:SAG11_NODE_213_length_12262_cov_8.391597_3_plen_171_part_00
MAQSANSMSVQHNVSVHRFDYCSLKCYRCPVQAQNALYHMVLANLLAAFRKACENDIIGDEAFSALDHAIGLANDASNTAHDLKQVGWKGAVVIMWNSITEYIRSGSHKLIGRNLPNVWFKHMLTTTEMLYITAEALKQLSSAAFMHGSIQGEDMRAEGRIRVETRGAIV